MSNATISAAARAHKPITQIDAPSAAPRIASPARVSARRRGGGCEAVLSGEAG
jgi:hypothetical protein